MAVKHDVTSLAETNWLLSGLARFCSGGSQMICAGFQHSTLRLRILALLVDSSSSTKLRSPSATGSESGGATRLRQ